MQGGKLANKCVLARDFCKNEAPEGLLSIINAVHGPIKARKTKAGDINSWLTILLYLLHQENKKNKNNPPKIRTT